VVDISAPWVIDDQISERYPVYTRGNVEEVIPDVISPLVWTAFAGPISENAWKQALIQIGAFEKHEFRPDTMEIQAVFRGYCYINLSMQWIFGVRMPGADPEAMSREYLGTRTDAPTYVAHEGDVAPHLTERMGAWVERMLAADPRSWLEHDAAEAAKIRAERPDLTLLSNSELLARHRTVMYDVYSPVLVKHFLLVYESSIAAGMLNSVLASLGDASLSVRLISGWGNVASAAPAAALWVLGRRVADSPALTALFDAGPDDLFNRLGRNNDAAVVDFLAQFEDFQREFGSRGSNEYEALAATWETHPALPLAMIDRLRLQPVDHDPNAKVAELAQRRTALVADVRAQLPAEQQDVFDTAMLAVERYLPARERSKTTMIRLFQEGRLALREIARRQVEEGHLQEIDDLSMLTLDEIPALLDDPAPWRATIADRWEWRARLQELEPPYVLNGEIPPVTRWPKKTASPVTPASAGDVLAGVGACPGSATGMARIVDDPADARDLEPGEILVAPETDPGWTPLFLSAAAVVVNAGNQLSHAAIISRELGIPCVLAVPEATRRIKNGTLLTVDGTHGTVTVH
jgi:rifampicin phosphotransferase